MPVAPASPPVATFVGAARSADRDVPTQRSPRGAKLLSANRGQTVGFVVDAVAVTTACVLSASGGWTSPAYAVALLVWLHLGTTRSIEPDAAVLYVVADVVAKASAALLVPPLLLLAADAGAIGRQAVWSIVALIVCRAVLIEVVRRGRRAGWLREPTLILGSGEVAEDLFETLRRAPEHGFEPIGLVADSASGSVPVACSLAELPVTVRVLAVRHVIVAFAPNRDSEIAATVRELRLGSTTQVHVVSRLFELGATGRVLGSSAVGPFRTTQLRRPPHRRPAYRAKRVFDVGVAGTLLVLFSPILAATAVAVRSTSRGPAFYRQTRIGRDGRLIELVKFRSMVVNGDGDTTWNVSNDERVTRVGRFLRRTSLDELPQLWNVLSGEMSLVGPRPERPHFALLYGERISQYSRRHDVPVGMTGWAQVHGLRGNTSIEERVRFDLDYIENWTFMNDLRILARTAREMLRGQ